MFLKTVIINAALLVWIVGMNAVCALISGEPFYWQAWLITCLILAAVDAAALLFLCSYGKIKTKKFYRKLSETGFTTEREYKWKDMIILFDFSDGKFACNHLVNAFVDRSAIAGYGADVTDKTKLLKLSQSERNVRLRISVENSDGSGLYHLYIYENIVHADELPSEYAPSVEELAAKYPKFDDMLKIKRDLDLLCESERKETDGYKEDINL